MRDEQSIRKEVSRIARSWLGTPFYPHMAKRGVGADCVNLALAIYKEAGVVPGSTTFPPYSLDQGDHLHISLVMQWLSSSPYFETESEMPRSGSLITLKIGRVIHHVGIMVGDTQFVQAIRNYGVVQLDLRDSTWMKKLRSSWKPKI